METNQKLLVLLAQPDPLKKGRLLITSGAILDKIGDDTAGQARQLIQSLCGKDCPAEFIVIGNTVDKLYQSPGEIKVESEHEKRVRLALGLMSGRITLLSLGDIHLLGVNEQANLTDWREKAEQIIAALLLE